MTHETTKFRVSTVKFVHYTDLYNQLIGVSRPNFRNFQLEEELISNINQTRLESNNILYRVRELEGLIKEVQPDFTSPISPISYPLISRS